MSADDRYRRAAAAGGVGIWDWNLATGEIYVDPILKQILGYEDREIRNHIDDWGRFVHPDDGAAVFASAQAHIAGETPLYEIEHRMVHRDGSIRWFLARGSVTRDAAGAAVSMAGTDTDITERKRGEEALRQAEEINRRIAEHTGDCVKILDLEGRLVYMNREGLRFLEVDAAHVLNRPLVGFFNGDMRAAAAAAVAEARAGGCGRFQGLLPGAVRPGAVVGHRRDADHRRGRRRRPAAGRLARHHRAAPRRGGPRGAAARARDDCHWQRARGRPRLPGAPGRAAGERHAVLGAAARRGRHPRPALRGTEPARRLRSRHRRAAHRSAQRLLRDRHVPRHAGDRHRHPHRSPLGRLPRAGAAGRAARLLVGADLLAAAVSRSGPLRCTTPSRARRTRSSCG